MRGRGNPLLRDARRTPEAFDLRFPASADDIATVESAIGHPLPSAFAEVLETLGQGTFFDSEILLGPHEVDDAIGDLVAINREMQRRQGLSDELVVFHLGLGGAHAFDTATGRPDYEVVALDEDTLARGRTFDSFETWYLEWLRAEYAEILGLE